MADDWCTRPVTRSVKYGCTYSRCCDTCRTQAAVSGRGSRSLSEKNVYDVMSDRYTWPPYNDTATQRS